MISLKEPAPRCAGSFFPRDKGGGGRQSGGMFALSIEGAVANLTLERPQARNAVPAAAWRDLAAAAAEAGNSARLLVLRGSGGAFCAGADLADFPAMQENASRRATFREDMRAALDALRDLAVPTIALIDGPCYGAGVALAIACDLRIAGPGAAFAITPAKFGISYPQPDVHRLVSLVGPGQAARLLLGAVRIDAAEAERIGLAELRCEDPEAELSALAEALLANDADSLATLKRAIALAARGVRGDAEQDARFDALIGSPAFATRLAAARGTRRLA